MSYPMQKRQQEMAEKAREEMDNSREIPKGVIDGFVNRVASERDFFWLNQS